MGIFTTGLVGKKTPQLGVKEESPPQIVTGSGVRPYVLLTTASWGPVDKVVTVGNMTEYDEELGGFDRDATDATKMTIGYHMAKVFLAYGSILRAVRIAGAAKAKATITIDGPTVEPTTNINSIVGTAVYYGTRGNDIRATISNDGTKFKLVQTLGLKTETFTDLDLTNIAVKTANSQIATWAAAEDAVENPEDGVYAFTGGNSGLTVTAADVLGGNVAGVKTGIELAKTVSDGRYLDIPDDLRELEGVAAAMTQTANIITALCLDNNAVGETEADYIVTADARATTDRHVACYNHIRVFEPVINTYVNVPATALMAGILAVVPMSYSPSQQPQEPDAAPVNADDVLVQLGEADVDTLTEKNINPLMFVPGQGIVFRAGYNRSNSAATNQIYRRVITDEIARAFKRDLRFAVSKPNTPGLRKRVKGAADSYLELLKANEIIEDYKVICDNTNNPLAVQNQHMLKAYALVKLYSMADLVEMAIEVGHTVQVA